VPNTGGTGLGQVGIRERAAAMGAEVEIGPRASRGYRVRVALPRKAAS
jgi:signal transduction histidine kinase